MTAKPPSCTSCGRELKPHCPDRAGDPSTPRCGWWRCSARFCGVDLHDFSRGLRTLTTGARERFAPLE